MPEIKALIFDCIDTIVKPDDTESRKDINTTLPNITVPYCIVVHNEIDLKKLKNSDVYKNINGLIFQAKNQNYYEKILKTMNITSKNCLAIVDNLGGTKSASALNMKILAYIGNKTSFVNYFNLRNAGAWGLLDEMKLLLFLTKKLERS